MNEREIELRNSSNYKVHLRKNREGENNSLRSYFLEEEDAKIFRGLLNDMVNLTVEEIKNNLNNEYEIFLYSSERTGYDTEVNGYLEENRNGEWTSID